MSEFKWPQEGAAGSGDVVGPASSTNNAVARFDGTTGKLLDNSGVIIDDSNNVTGVADLAVSGDATVTGDVDAATVKLPGGDVQTQLDGKVSGAGTVVDNRLVRFSGTGGLTIDQSPLTVSDAGVASGLSVVEVRNDGDLSGAGAYMVQLENRNDAAASSPYIEWRRARAANADLVNGDTVGRVDAHARFSGQTSSVAKIECLYTGDGTTRLADVVFYTSNTGAPAERMRIAADGSVNVSGATASRVLTTDASKNLVSSSVTTTTLGYLDATSSIQTQLNGKQATGNYITGLTGDVSASGPGSVAATLAAVGTAGTYVKVTTDSKGRVTAGTAGPLPIADGGTGQTGATAAFDALAPTTTLGDTVYHNGTDNVRLAGNTTTAKQYLTQTGNGSASAAPVWSAFPGATNCAAYLNSSQSGITSGNSQKVQFGTEEYDNGSFYDNATNYRIQPTIAGKYQISWGVRVFGAVGDAVRVALTTLYKNGSAFKNGSGFGHGTAAQCDSYYSSGSILVDANGSTDYFEIFAAATVTSSTWVIGSGQGNTFFTCVRVSD